MNLGYTYAKYNQKIYFMGDGAELCYKSYYEKVDNIALVPVARYIKYLSGDSFIKE